MSFYQPWNRKSHWPFYWNNISNITAFRLHKYHRIFSEHSLIIQYSNVTMLWLFSWITHLNNRLLLESSGIEYLIVSNKFFGGNVWILIKRQTCQSKALRSFRDYVWNVFINENVFSRLEKSSECVVDMFIGINFTTDFFKTVRNISNVKWKEIFH